MDIFFCQRFLSNYLSKDSVWYKAYSDELYCVTKTATYCISVPLFVFSFSPVKISVSDFSVPMGASVFKFCVHLKVC